MARTVAVLDVGKTNIKLLVFSGDTIVFRRSAPNTVQGGPPYPHFDTDAIWHFCLLSLRDAAAAHAIDAIVTTTHGGSVTMFGEGDLAAPVMDYEFLGLDADEPAYARVRPPFDEILTPRMGGGLNWARQIFHVQQHHPHLFAGIRHILMYPQYWGWRFTGQVRNEVTNLGCHSDIWNPRTGTYSSLVARLAWEDLFPPVVPAWAELGPITAAVAEATGLPPTTPVLAGLHDSNSALIPHLLSLPAPFTVISTGTWVVIVGVGAPVERVREGDGTQANIDVLGRPGPVARFMGGREYAVLTDGFAQDADADDLEAVLASDALATPSFAPHGSPIPGQGRIEGTLPDRPGARAALATLYEALFTDHQLDKLGADEGPLVVEGPFAANPLYGAVLAALRPGQAVLVDSDTAGAAYGAALLAGWPEKPERPELAKARPFGNEAALHLHKERWRASLPS